jgi:hypothetical protein
MLPVPVSEWDPELPLSNQAFSMESYTGEKVMDHSPIRNLYYEAKPFMVSGLGLYATTIHYMGAFGKIASLVLIACGFSILYMRGRYRGLIR